MGPKNKGDHDTDIFAAKRRKMVKNQLAERGIRNPGVIGAFLKVPRHNFVSPEFHDYAYDDCPLPIGGGQTISQPYIVALMTELVDPKAGDRVLEVGTGSGYQAGILAEMGCEVYTIEIIAAFSKRAAKILDNLGYKNIEFKVGDGYIGWKEKTPFDEIIVTAAPEHLPSKLINQLKTGGRMVIPIGGTYQDLMLVKKTPKGVDIKTITPVRFVPMTGKAQENEQENGQNSEDKVPS